MTITRQTLFSLLTAALLSACGASVTPSSDRDASGADAAVSTDVAVGCRLPNGVLCAAGSVCALDACNTCRCLSNGIAQCTLLACADGGPTVPPTEERVCTTSADCDGRALCVFTELSCTTTGTCQLNTEICLVPETFCSCAGETYQSCNPDRPTHSLGACGTTVDAGVVGGCEGAHLGRDGASCVGPDDSPRAVECCRNWDCDTRRLLCDGIPPVCRAGYVASATPRGCYGPCVPANQCAPMRCDPSAACPEGFACTRSNTCAPAL